MVERLTKLDASFLYLEEPGTPMHVGGVLILERPPGGVEALAALVQARLPLVPRYRQRVAEVPGHLADPVWVDDPDFDIDYHVRRSGLPRPGTEAQLLDLVSRLTSRPLDRRRPLWEAYLVEGLSDDRVAVVTKTHPALVDGLSALDIGQVLLDVDPHAPIPPPEEWRPKRPPNGVALMWDALDEYARRPSAVVDTMRGAVTDVRSTAARVTGVAGGLLRTARKTLMPAPHSPLNATVSRQRRVAVARADLDDLKRIRKAHGGTINDVLLTVVTGALREWLLSRGEPVVAGTSVRALVPVSMQDEDAAAGNRVSSYLVDLPVGEPNPRVRLTRLSYAMRGIALHGQSVGADSLIALTGFAPPTLHALGARAARGLSRRLFNLVVTNVPGPQLPLYAAGSRMLEVFPVVPLARGQGLSVGMTSYDGRVYFGFNADRDGVGDVDVLADLVEQEVGQLVETAGCSGLRDKVALSTKGAIRVRVYLPATTTVLRTLVDEGALPGPHTVFAVTPELRHFYQLSDADADVEELEYAALLGAARASLRLIDIDPTAARRRVVVAVDVPDDAVRPIDDPDTDRGAARVEGEIRVKDVASAHIDGADAEDDVRAAVNVVLEADLGSEDAQFVVDQAEGHELAWYARQEMGSALELL